MRSRLALTMFVVESIAPADALAARRSLRAQIARLEGELATILASTYPPVAPPPARAGAPGRPHLLDLAELERARDDLAGRVTAAHHARERQSARQSQARALLLDMLENPLAHKGTRIRNADLGLPGCTSYRVLPRLGPVGVLTGWWRVKVSSGCPLPSAANVSRRNRKRRTRPTAPAVPPRPPRRTRPRLEDRPKAPWHPVPLVEIAVFVGLVLIVVGLITSDSRRGRTLLLLGLALGSLGGLDTTLREHFAGHRSHTLVLALAPAVAIAAALAVAGAPVPLVLIVAVAVFGAAFTLLRGAWRRATA